MLDSNDVAIVAMLSACFGFALGVPVLLFRGADKEAARWRYGAQTCTPVASYADGNKPSYYLVVALDDVQPGIMSNYDVTDARTGRSFRVKVVPLVLVPPQGGSGTASPSAGCDGSGGA